MNAQQVWKDFSHRLKGYISKRVRDERDAEDILQEVFAKIHCHIGSLRDEDRLKSWVYRITSNAISDHYRRRKAPTEPLDDHEPVAVDPPAVEDSGEISSCLRALIDRMPRKYGQALALTELEGMTQQALAEKLHLSFSGAKSRVQRGRENLKKMLLAGCDLEFGHLGDLMDCRPKEGKQGPA